MGYAEILGGGTDGRYTIRLDYGSEIKTAILASLAQLLAKLELDLAEAQNRLTAAQEVEATQRAITDDAIAVYAQFLRDLPPGAPPPPTGQIEGAITFLRRMQLDLLPLQLAVDAIKQAQVETRKRVAYWNQFQPFVTRQAWCVDYTEEPAATQFAATIEVPGEPSITLLAPGVRGWTPADGIVRAREIMSPEQAFFNAAILPGWQRHMPTFRWGTASAIDYDANTMTVELAPAQSSAQSLPINRDTALQNVPVTYMTCNAAAFESGDRVVVQFEGQSWNSPRVVGFLDNPRPCGFEVTFSATTFSLWSGTLLAPDFTLGTFTLSDPSPPDVQRVLPGENADPVQAPATPSGFVFFHRWFKTNSSGSIQLSQPLAAEFEREVIVQDVLADIEARARFRQFRPLLARGNSIQLGFGEYQATMVNADFYGIGFGSSVVPTMVGAPLLGPTGYTSSTDAKEYDFPGFTLTDGVVTVTYAYAGRYAGPADFKKVYNPVSFTTPIESGP